MDVILVEAAFYILDHETRLAYLRISNHADFDHDAVLLLVIFHQRVGVLSAWAGHQRGRSWGCRIGHCWPKWDKELVAVGLARLEDR